MLITERSVTFCAIFLPRWLSLLSVIYTLTITLYHICEIFPPKLCSLPQERFSSQKLILLPTWNPSSHESPPDSLTFTWPLTWLWPWSFMTYFDLGPWWWPTLISNFDDLEKSSEPKLDFIGFQKWKNIGPFDSHEGKGEKRRKRKWIGGKKREGGKRGRKERKMERSL